MTLMQYPVTFTLLCLALVAASFARARRTSHRTTARAVRWCISAQGMAATAGAIAPWLLRWPPSWLPVAAQQVVPDVVVLLLVASMAATQAVTSHLWRAGVPEAFQRRHCGVSIPAPRGGTP